MTQLLLAIASMSALALAAWLAGRVLRFALCPVCVGVAGTWIWMVAARMGGYAADTAILAVLLGASVVGLAQAIESRLPPARSALLWKATAIPVGCAAAYGLATEVWILAAGSAAAFALLAMLFVRPPRAASGDPAIVAHLEERMKKCC
jgi:hypothetical protein